jgi:hypothetical protein
MPAVNAGKVAYNGREFRLSENILAEADLV